jgi:hypothetical protein
MASKAEQRSDAMKVLRNPEDHSKAEIAKAKKVIADYDAIQGGDMAVAITVGVLPKSKKKMLQKKQKAKMAMGGMANNKKHMYLSNGGSVTDNLKPMPTGSKGKGVRSLPDPVQINMGFDPNS